MLIWIVITSLLEFVRSINIVIIITIIIYPKIVNLPQIVTYLRNNQLESWLEVEPATTSYECDIPTTRPLSHSW